jgi:hypothetical protein
MEYKIEELDISNKLIELGITLPEKIAFFPENLDIANTKSDFIFTDSLLDLKKIFHQENDISIETLGQDTELYRSRKSSDIYLPAMFLGLSLISENSTLVSVSLNVLSNYVYDFCKGTVGNKTAHIDLYIETKEKGKIKKISYKGNVEGLKDLEKIIKEM